MGRRNERIPSSHHPQFLEGYVAQQKRTEPFEANEGRKYCQNTPHFFFYDLKLTGIDPKTLLTDVSPENQVQFLT